MTLPIQSIPVSPERGYSPDNHPLRNVPVEGWMFRRAREQAQLLMQLFMEKTDAAEHRSR
jgi:hypothetical protein